VHESAVTSYDEIPYDSKPLYSTHPDCLATAGRLRGLSPAPASRCRVLELGCGTGGNLIPMAYSLPGSRFVGIDLSGRQIAAGQGLCRRLGLTNIDLRETSITDVEASWGQFDYIICHGVFSWVPRSVQDHVLWICQHLLAPQGIAYISYNTYPGWHLRNVVRDLMRYHAARYDDAPTKISQARSILAFMAKAAAGLDGAMPAVLASEAQSLPEAPDYYLYHEHLEESNQPLYFHEFVERARQSKLQYLGEAWHHTQFDSLDGEVRDTLEAISSDLVEMEQFADFLSGRTFRRTLVCHAERPITQTPQPEVVAPLLVTALAQPLSDKPDIASPAVERFRLDNGATASTNHPLFKAALVELYRQWPAAVPFDELLAAALRHARLAAEERKTAPAVLASLLVRGYVSHLVAIHSEPFRFARELAERPRASRLVRLAAAEREMVPNLRHRLVGLSPAERVVAQLADGTLTILQLGRQAIDRSPEILRPALATSSLDLAAFIDRCLQRLLRNAILEVEPASEATTGPAA